MSATPILKTIRALRDVKSINDIVAIESEPYDANIGARSLYDLLTATAALHPERHAVTILAGDRSLEPLSSLTHSQLLTEVTRTANLFAALNREREGVVGVLYPTLPEIPVALLGAQVVGVASAINYPLNRPEALNALSRAMMQSLDRALDEIVAHERVRAVVVTGAGKAFGAGGDLAEFSQLLEADASRLLTTLEFNQRASQHRHASALQRRALFRPRFCRLGLGQQGCPRCRAPRRAVSLARSYTRHSGRVLTAIKRLTQGAAPQSRSVLDRSSRRLLTM